jgi:hypothetical protein
MKNFTEFEFYNGGKATFETMMVRTSQVVALKEFDHNHGKMPYNKLPFEVCQLITSTGNYYEVTVKNKPKYNSAEIVLHYVQLMNNNDKRDARTI